MHELLSAGQIDIETIITNYFPITEFEQGMELATSGNCGKVVLQFPSS